MSRRSSPWGALAALILPAIASGCAARDAFQDAGPGAQTCLGLELRPLASPAGPATGMPSLCPGADGSLYLSWIEQRAEPSGSGGEELQHATLWHSRRADSRWSEPRKIASGNSLFVNWADFPALCALADGTLAASWLQKSGAETYAYDALFALSRDGGRSWSAPRALHDDRSPAEHGFVSWVALGRQGFGALWLDGRDTVGRAPMEGETGLYFRTVSARGELGAEQCLNPRVCDCCSTALVGRGSGELCAAYRDRTSAEIRDISFLRRTAQGWSEPRAVHDDLWHIPGCPVNGPRLAAGQGPHGPLASAWFTGAGGGGGNVYVAFLESEQRGFGATIDVDDGRPEGRVDLLFLDDGSLLVAWLEHIGLEGSWRVRRVHADGTATPSLELARTSADRPAGQLRMALGSEGVVLAWTAPGEPARVNTALLRAPR